MKYLSVLLLMVLIRFLGCQSAFAESIRSAYILYTWVQPYTCKIDVQVYSIQNNASYEEDSIQIDLGDGVIDTIPRINGNGKGVDAGNVLYSVYEVTHTYPGYGNYIISFTGYGRIPNIVNITLPASTPFFIADTIGMISNSPDVLNHNTSVVFNNMPVGFANFDKTFTYLPDAYDADGDSLSFELAVPLMGLSQEVDGYIQPNRVGVTGTPTRSFTINANTGEITWNIPQFCGVYVIGMLVHEWRKTLGTEAVLMGTTRVDMQIIVSCSSGIEDVVENEDLVSIYPNPVNDNFIVKANGLTGGNIAVADMFGRILLLQKAVGNETTININKLPQGLYFIHIRQKGMDRISKLVKQ